MTTPRKTVLAVGITLLSLALLAGGCGSAKPVIKLYDGQWESLWINNAIFKFIVEEGYGYPVQTVAMPSLVMHEDLPKGKIDLNMEAWQQDYVDWYEEQIEKGDIANLGMTYEAGPQFFMIPKWVAEEYNVQTVFDMTNHWELFKDPGDPARGVFYNCLISWNCDEVNRVKLEAYGLTKYYNVVSPGSTDALEAALTKAQDRHQPVFGYYWAPSRLMGAYDWYILEEPAYTEQVWDKVMAATADESLRPIDQACAYQTVPIDKIAHQGLFKKAPDVVKMLEKMVVGLEPLNEIMGWAEEHDVQDWEMAAVHYLRTYEDRWRGWVTEEAYRKIVKALGEASE
jgi:glycine betaine/proline transport system substrate-binding protein